MTRAEQNTRGSQRTWKRRAQRAKLASRLAGEAPDSRVAAGQARRAVPGATDDRTERVRRGQVEATVPHSSRSTWESGQAQGAVPRRPSREFGQARGAVPPPRTTSSRPGPEAGRSKENAPSNQLDRRGRSSRSAPKKVDVECRSEDARRAVRAERETSRREERARRVEEQRAAARRAREGARLAAIRQREEEAEWHRRTVAAELRRAEAERRRASLAASVRTSRYNPNSATAGPSRSRGGYDPNAPGVEAHRLLEKKRGRPGSGDPRRRGPPRNRAAPLILRVPAFVQEGRYAFPPLRFTRPGIAQHDPPIIVDCPNSPPLPAALRAPPSAPLPPPSEIAAVCSPIAGPSREAIILPPTPGTPDDDDVLLLSAYDTPELFSPSLTASTPPRGSAQPCRRNLRF